MVIAANFVYVSRDGHTRRSLFDVSRRLRDGEWRVLESLKQFDRVMLVRIKAELHLEKS